MKLETPGAPKLVAEHIKSAIEKYAKAAYDDGHRKHLGASLIGHACARYLYNTFRWVSHEDFSGRMLRLFNRGHREEAHFLAMLRGIGFRFEEREAGKQIRIEDVDGHFGGSLDEECWFPITWEITEKILLEFKTNGTGGGFNELVKKGVAVAKPQHWAQMCTYGFKRGLRYALYMCVNKNDDEIHIEIVKLDWRFGEELIRRANGVIYAKSPPERISENAAYYECQMCAFHTNCHEGKPAEKNCRSCQQSEPRPNKEWFCTRWKATIPDDVIKVGCPHHNGIVG